LGRQVDTGAAKPGVAIAAVAVEAAWQLLELGSFGSIEFVIVAFLLSIPTPLFPDNPLASRSVFD